MTFAEQLNADAMAKIAAKNESQDANERIKKAFPEMRPSGGNDYVEELIGLLRVTRGQRDSMEQLWLETRRILDEPKAPLITTSVN